MMKHRIALFFSRFKKRPNVRRSVWIDPKASVPKDATVGERCKIKGNVKIGKRFFCIDDVQLWGGKVGIVIGDNVRIYAKVIVDVGNHDENDLDFKYTSDKSVKIKDYAVLDNSCIVCKGVTVGRGAIIKEGAVVIEDVPDMAVMAGNPAIITGYRKN